MWLGVDVLRWGGYSLLVVLSGTQGNANQGKRLHLIQKQHCGRRTRGWFVAIKAWGWTLNFAVKVCYTWKWNQSIKVPNQPHRPAYLWLELLFQVLGGIFLMTRRWRVTRVLLGTESAADWTIGSLGQCWKCWKHGDFCFHQFCHHWDWQLCIQWTIRPGGTGNMLTPLFTKSSHKGYAAPKKKQWQLFLLSQPSSSY